MKLTSLLNEGFKANSSLANYIRLLKKNGPFGDVRPETIKALQDLKVTSDVIFQLAAIFPKDTFRIDDIVSGKLKQQIRRVYINDELQAERIKQVTALKQLVKELDSTFGDRSWTSK